MGNDLPTLRLVTLRRLLAKAPPHVVFDVRTAPATIAAAIRRTGAVAVLVDGHGVLRGTLALADLEAADGSVRPEVRAIIAPILVPESNLEDAHTAMQVHGCERVVVATIRGELLGVLTRRDLARGAARSAA
jgi:CBS domain-containing protein